MIVKKIIYDVKKRVGRIIEEDIELPVIREKEPILLDLKDLGKLIQYAKKQGWI